MKKLLLGMAMALSLLSHLSAEGENQAAVIDGPGYAFTIAAPKGWELTSTPELPAAFHPADAPFDRSPVVMYVKPANLRELHVSTIEQLNALDLKGIRRQHPEAASERAGTVKAGDGRELPVYAFTGGGYVERIAYAKEGKTITVLALSAETEDQMKAALPAFEALVSSYTFLTDQPHLPKPTDQPRDQRPHNKPSPVSPD